MITNERMTRLCAEHDDLIRDVEAVIKAGERSGAAPSPQDERALDDAMARLKAINDELNGKPSRRPTARTIAEKVGLLAIAQCEARKARGMLPSHEYLRDVVRDPLLAVISRAAVSPATSSTAADLLGTLAQEVCDYLRSRPTFLARLPPFLPLGRSGGLRLSQRNGAKAGGWIGEGAPIPVKSDSLTGRTLTPKKCGAISFGSREVFARGFESYVGSMLLDDLGDFVDSTLVGNGAGSATTPTGLLHSTNATIVAAGADAPTDVAAVYTAHVSAGGRPATSLWLVPAGVMAKLTGITILGALANSGRLNDIPIVVHASAVAKSLSLIDTAEIIGVTGSEFGLEQSTVTALAADDAPAAPSTVTPLFQGDLIASKVTASLDWGTRQAAVTSCITTWG